MSAPSSRFDDMFESGDLDAAGVLAAAETNLRQRRTAEADLLRIAAGWADLHPEDWMPPPVDDEGRTRRRLADEEPVLMGGEGTPKVIAYCPAELGLILETTYTGAKHLIADALDLQYRLPKLWATVESGKVAAWKARRVATATRALTKEQAAQVDKGVHAAIATLGWSRFELILDATLKRADPETARAEEEAAATRRFVAVGRANDQHIMTLIARGTSLDILSFMASVNRIAEILEADGDLDPVDVRRSKAIGILARPAKALDLLAAHQDSSAKAEEPYGRGTDGAGARPRTRRPPRPEATFPAGPAHPSLPLWAASPALRAPSRGRTPWRPKRGMSHRRDRPAHRRHPASLAWPRRRVDHRPPGPHPRPARRRQLRNPTGDPRGTTAALTGQRLPLVTDSGPQS